MRLKTIWECSRSAQIISIVDNWWIRSSSRSYNSIKGINWNIIKTDNSQVMFKSAITDLIFKSSQVRWLIPDLIFKSSQVRSMITDLIFKSSQVDLTWLDLTWFSCLSSRLAHPYSTTPVPVPGVVLLVYSKIGLLAVLEMRCGRQVIGWDFANMPHHWLGLLTLLIIGQKKAQGHTLHLEPSNLEARRCVGRHQQL